MIHIVFNEPDVKVLQQAIELDESLQGEIVQVKDDYAVGPLNNIYIGEGIEERKQWWRDVLAGGDYESKVRAIGRNGGANSFQRPKQPHQ